MLSFLFRIKQKYTDVEMTIVADKFSPNTTSDIGQQLLFFFRVSGVLRVLEEEGGGGLSELKCDFFSRCDFS